MRYLLSVAATAAFAFQVSAALADEEFPYYPELSTSKLLAEVIDDPSLGAADPDKARKLIPLALDLIKDFERWEPRPYEDSSHYCTIGYGHLIAKKRCREVLEEIAKFHPPMAVEEGLKRLDSDTAIARFAVTRMVNHTLPDERFGAVVSFVFNVGSGDGEFKTSRMRMRLNEENYAGAAREFPKWVRSGKDIVDGLINRRSCERRLFDGKVAYRKDGKFYREDCITLGGAPESGQTIDIMTGK